MTADAEDRPPEPIPADNHETRPDTTAVPAPATDAGTQADGAQSELDLGVLSTGSLSVDSALAPLDGLAARPVSGHAEVFEQVLDELTETMAEPTAEPDPHTPAAPGVPPASR